MMLYRIAPPTADQKPATWKTATHEPTAQNSRPLITKMNSPSVSSVAGSVRMISNGLMKVLINPRTSAAISAAANESTRIDDIRYGSARSAAVLINQTSSSRIAQTLVPIGLGLVRSHLLDADVACLLVGELCQHCPKLFQLQPRDFLVEMFRQHVHAHRILRPTALGVAPELDLR